MSRYSLTARSFDHIFVQTDLGNKAEALKVSLETLLFVNVK